MHRPCWSCRTVICFAAGSPVPMKAVQISASSARSFPKTVLPGFLLSTFPAIRKEANRIPPFSTVPTMLSGRCTPRSSTVRPARTICSLPQSSAARRAMTEAAPGVRTRRSSPRKVPSAVSRSRSFRMVAGSSRTGSAPTPSTDFPVILPRSVSPMMKARPGRWS